MKHERRHHASTVSRARLHRRRYCQLGSQGLVPAYIWASVLSASPRCPPHPVRPTTLTPPLVERPVMPRPHIDLLKRLRRAPIGGDPKIASASSARTAPSPDDGRAPGERNEYLEQYARLHRDVVGYGASSEQQLGYIQRVVCELPAIRTILDYGCGQSRLVDWLAKLNDATAYRYDPAIPDYATLPLRQADLVLNTDVLEHIPKDEVDTFIRHISTISSRVYFNISTVPATQTLPNGMNAHCTVQPADWWQERLAKSFRYVRRVKSYRESTCSFVTWKKPEAAWR